MRARRLLLLGFVYLAFDLADPALPGAFSFEVRDSEIEEAVHTQRRPEDRQPIAAPPAPRVGPRDDSFALQHRTAVTWPDTALGRRRPGRDRLSVFGTALGVNGLLDLGVPDLEAEGARQGRVGEVEGQIGEPEEQEPTRPHALL